MNPPPPFFFLISLQHRFGGWIIDSFPMTRENWTAMIDNELLPDVVVSLEDDEASDDYLLERFKKIHNLQSPMTNEEVCISYHSQQLC